jgi:hypothetical protein
LTPIFNTPYDTPYILSNPKIDHALITLYLPLYIHKEDKKPYPLSTNQTCKEIAGEHFPRKCGNNTAKDHVGYDVAKDHVGYDVPWKL